MMMLKIVGIKMTLIQNYYKCKIKSEDIDKFGHLHNSCYSEYFDNARESLQNKLNLSDDYLIERGIGLLISEANYKYRNQVKLSDKLIIISEMKYEGGVRIYIEHEMKVNDLIMATGKTTHYFFDLNKQKPIKPIQEFLDLLNIKNTNINKIK